MEALFLYLLYVVPFIGVLALMAWVSSKLDDRP